MKLRWKILGGFALAAIIGGTWASRTLARISILNGLKVRQRLQSRTVRRILFLFWPMIWGSMTSLHLAVVLQAGKFRHHRLARQGAIFTQAYAGNATCAPSRAMLMTGRYPTRTGYEYTPTPPSMGRIVTMISNDLKAKGKSPIPRSVYTKPDGDVPDFYGQGLPASEVTIAETLKDKGYHTVHIGKWHLGYG